MSQDVKDFFQVCAWVVAILGGLVAAHKAIVEIRRSNEQHALDLRWKQASMAKVVLDELRRDPLASAALKMLDWSGLTYVRPDGRASGAIDAVPRRVALRTTGTVFPADSDAPFIRDAFDALLDAFERFEQFLRAGLIRFDDVEQALRYYVLKMAAPDERPVVDEFTAAYGFTLAREFLKRFPDWCVKDKATASVAEPEAVRRVNTA